MQLLARMTAVLLGVMSLAGCASIMIVSNAFEPTYITGYQVGDGTRLNGNVPPDLRLSGNAVSSGFGVAAYYNKVYVVSLFDSIAVFEVGLGGYTSQLSTIAGDATGLNEPDFVAVDSGGNIYVVGGPFVAPKVLVYAKGASGNVAPIATIAGSNTGLLQPNGIAVDGAGRIYVLNLGGSNPSDASVTVYAPGTNGNRKPIAMITGPHTQLGPGLQGIAVDADGTIFVTNWDFNSVTVHAPGANGNVPPIAVIQGGNTGLSQPVGIAVGFGHRLYVTNFGLPRPYTVTVYPAGANGDVAPLATLTGSATGLAQPVAIALACVFAGIVPLSPGC